MEDYKAGELVNTMAAPGPGRPSEDQLENRIYNAPASSEADPARQTSFSPAPVDPDGSELSRVHGQLGTVGGPFKGCSVEEECSEVGGVERGGDEEERKGMEGGDVGTSAVSRLRQRFESKKSDSSPKRHHLPRLSDEKTKGNLGSPPEATKILFTIDAEPEAGVDGSLAAMDQIPLAEAVQQEPPGALAVEQGARFGAGVPVAAAAPLDVGWVEQGAAEVEDAAEDSVIEGGQKPEAELSVQMGGAVSVDDGVMIEATAPETATATAAAALSSPDAVVEVESGAAVSGNPEAAAINVEIATLSIGQLVGETFGELINAGSKAEAKQPVSVTEAIIRGDGMLPEAEVETAVASPSPDAVGEKGPAVTAPEDRNTDGTVVKAEAAPVGLATKELEADSLASASLEASSEPPVAAVFEPGKAGVGGGEVVSDVVGGLPASVVDGTSAGPSSEEEVENAFEVAPVAATSSAAAAVESHGRVGPGELAASATLSGVVDVSELSDPGTLPPDGKTSYDDAKGATSGPHLLGVGGEDNVADVVLASKPGDGAQVNLGPPLPTIDSIPAADVDASVTAMDSPADGEDPGQLCVAAVEQTASAVDGAEKAAINEEGVAQAGDELWESSPVTDQLLGKEGMDQAATAVQAATEDAISAGRAEDASGKPAAFLASSVPGAVEEEPQPSENMSATSPQDAVAAAAEGDDSLLEAADVPPAAEIDGTASIPSLRDNVEILDEPSSEAVVSAPAVVETGEAPAGVEREDNETKLMGAPADGSSVVDADVGGPVTMSLSAAAENISDGTEPVADQITPTADVGGPAGGDDGGESPRLVGSVATVDGLNSSPSLVDGMGAIEPVEATLAAATPDNDAAAGDDVLVTVVRDDTHTLNAEAQAAACETAAAAAASSISGADVADEPAAPVPQDPAANMTVADTADSSFEDGIGNTILDRLHDAGSETVQSVPLAGAMVRNEEVLPEAGIPETVAVSTPDAAGLEATASTGSEDSVADGVVVETEVAPVEDPTEVLAADPLVSDYPEARGEPPAAEIFATEPGTAGLGGEEVPSEAAGWLPTSAVDGTAAGPISEEEVENVAEVCTLTATSSAAAVESQGEVGQEEVAASAPLSSVIDVSELSDQGTLPPGAETAREEAMSAVSSTGKDEIAADIVLAARAGDEAQVDLGPPLPVTGSIPAAGVNVSVTSMDSPADGEYPGQPSVLAGEQGSFAVDEAEPAAMEGSSAAQAGGVESAVPNGVSEPSPATDQVPETEVVDQAAMTAHAATEDVTIMPVEEVAHDLGETQVLPAPDSVEEEPQPSPAEEVPAAPADDGVVAAGAESEDPLPEAMGSTSSAGIDGPASSEISKDDVEILGESLSEAVVSTLAAVERAETGEDVESEDHVDSALMGATAGESPVPDADVEGLVAAWVSAVTETISDGTQLIADHIAPTDEDVIVEDDQGGRSPQPLSSLKPVDELNLSQSLVDGMDVVEPVEAMVAATSVGDEAAAGDDTLIAGVRDEAKLEAETQAAAQATAAAAAAAAAADRSPSEAVVEDKLMAKTAADPMVGATVTDVTHAAGDALVDGVQPAASMPGAGSEGELAAADERKPGMAATATDGSPATAASAAAAKRDADQPNLTAGPREPESSDKLPPDTSALSEGSAENVVLALETAQQEPLLQVLPTASVGKDSSMLHLEGPGFASKESATATDALVAATSADAVAPKAIVERGSLLQECLNENQGDPGSLSASAEIPFSSVGDEEGAVEAFLAPTPRAASVEDDFSSRSIDVTIASSIAGWDGQVGSEEPVEGVTIRGDPAPPCEPRTLGANDNAPLGLHTTATADAAAASLEAGVAISAEPLKDSAAPVPAPASMISQQFEEEKLPFRLPSAPIDPMAAARSKKGHQRSLSRASVFGGDMGNDARCRTESGGGDATPPPVVYGTSIRHAENAHAAADDSFTSFAAEAASSTAERDTFDFSPSVVIETPTGGSRHPSDSAVDQGPSAVLTSAGDENFSSMAEIALDAFETEADPVAHDYTVQELQGALSPVLAEEDEKCAEEAAVSSSILVADDVAKPPLPVAASDVLAPEASPRAHRVSAFGLQGSTSGAANANAFPAVEGAAPKIDEAKVAGTATKHADVDAQVAGSKKAAIYEEDFLAQDAGKSALEMPPSINAGFSPLDSKEAAAAAAAAAAEMPRTSNTGFQPLATKEAAAAAAAAAAAGWDLCGITDGGLADTTAEFGAIDLSALTEEFESNSSPHGQSRAPAATVVGPRQIPSAGWKGHAEESGAVEQPDFVSQELPSWAGGGEAAADPYSSSPAGNTGRSSGDKKCVIS